MKRVQRSILKLLNQLSMAQIGFGSALTLTAIGCIDYFITLDLGMSIFYVLPIACIVWYLNSNLGYLASGVSALLWCFAEIARIPLDDFNPIFLAWNTSVRLAFFLLVVYLMSELKLAYRQEQYLANTDSLTSLLNRRAFVSVLEQEIQRSQRYAFAFTLTYLDVDNFKQVNDQFGHAAGDRLLQQIAAVLVQQLRAVDSSARLGGDEFAILMPQTDQMQATAVLKRIFDNLSELRSLSASIGFSVGAVSFVSPLPESADQALAAADKLMYRVKDRGKHQLWQTTHQISSSTT